MLKSPHKRQGASLKLESHSKTALKDRSLSTQSFRSFFEGANQQCHKPNDKNAPGDLWHVRYQNSFGMQKQPEELEHGRAASLYKTCLGGR